MNRFIYVILFITSFAYSQNVEDVIVENFCECFEKDKNEEFKIKLFLDCSKNIVNSYFL